VAKDLNITIEVDESRLLLAIDRLIIQQAVNRLMESACSAMMDHGSCHMFDGGCNYERFLMRESLYWNAHDFRLSREGSTLISTVSRFVDQRVHDEELNYDGYGNSSLEHLNQELMYSYEMIEEYRAKDGR
jgi:hypothetical protein